MKKQILTGRLEFLRTDKPIKLISGSKEIDLWNLYGMLFMRLNGKKVSLDYGMNYITIKHDEESEFLMSYENDGNGISAMLTKIEGFGFSNLMAYLPDMFQRLNGRNVIVSIDDNEINITNDPSEIVFGLYYTNSNSCHISDDAVKKVCKIGTKDACIFCTVGVNGFECQKFDSYMARQILYKHSEGEMNASRIGDCSILGRKEI